MTDKEQLNKIKEKYMEREYDYALCSMDIDWLIQQAERTEALENKYLALRNIHNITLKTGELVAEENKRYKQAMEKIREMSKDSVIDRKYFEIADEGLKEDIK